ncbi:MAG TPA: phosphoribosylamine--glycine ligase [Cyclobacteriaceae bacterium]|nr:phosphoribosylamine--glycine ligase [Cyclobacteriaceae bacterium]
MNILIVGNGGREHALAWKIKQSKLCDELYVAPGNAGTSKFAQNLSINSDDFGVLGNFCVNHDIQLVIVGPETPLVKGIRDYFESDELLKHVLLVGPGKAGAELEGSKDFAKRFMLRHGIPTAKARVFQANEMEEALDYISTCKPPIVLKADGLAAGKGVIISISQREAKSEIREMLLNKKFGEASAKVLVEEFLTGIELSVFVLTDGQDYVILPEAKDYKRIGDGDTGLNTGGMGAVSPVVFADSSFMSKVEERIVRPTINGLKKEGIPYKGFIFIGLMNMGGNPYVIEYNVRMGDPETQAVIPRIKSDLVELMIAAAKGNLKNFKLEIDDRFAVSVVMVSGGYPNAFSKGKVVQGLDAAKDALIFHAGTRINTKDVITDGGRVLAITGMDESLENARKKAYMGVSHVSWEEAYFRKDIGMDLLKLI